MPLTGISVTLPVLSEKQILSRQSAATQYEKPLSAVRS